ncbi:ABC transporter permease [Halocatena halophila]|uniref:ABC transporter permease n=1 Tax=Halocatena halophila TaxID=2814576 RepID=UPI002ECFBBC3
MSTLTVAKKDFQDAARSRLLAGLIVVFALFQTGIIYWMTQVTAGGESIEMASVLDLMIIPTYILLPIIGTMIGYKSIVGERNSGSLKFLLGLPHSRRDVVLGKFLGRGLLVTVAVLGGFIVGGGLLFASTSSFDPAVFVGYVLTTILLGVTFVAVAVAFSSVTKSTSIATSGAIALVMVFLFLWNVVMMIASELAIRANLMDRLQPGEIPPDWYLFLQNLNPTNAYANVIASLVGNSSAIDSVFTEDWFGLLVLGGWIVVMVGLALIRFERVDL